METKKQLPPNLTVIGRNLFLVRTQAGFNKACKKVSDEGRLKVNRYPKSYPALVTINVGYFGYHFLDVSCYSLDEVKEVIDANILGVDVGNT